MSLILVLAAGMFWQTGAKGNRPVIKPSRFSQTLVRYPHPKSQEKFLQRTLAMLPTSSSGVPYLPDGAINAPAPPRAPRPLWLVALIFLGIFALLQWRWGEARDTWVERLVIHEATVKPAAALIRLISPQIPALPVGASIKAPGGGLNILNGCEGIEVMFLLAAAFAALRLPWRSKLSGLALGLGLVYMLNQGRILALFYAYRADRALFDALHTLILPVLLIALVTLYVHAFLHYCRPD